MPTYNIQNGPNEGALIAALANRMRCQQVYFRLAQEGDRWAKATHVYVDGLECETDFEHTWRVTLSPVKPGDRLVGLFCTSNSRGTLQDEASASNPPLAMLGFEPESVEMLLRARVRWLRDLKSLNELTVCNLLVERGGGAVATPAQVSCGIERFLRLRARMDALGHEFDGPRGNIHDFLLVN